MSPVSPVFHAVVTWDWSQLSRKRVDLEKEKEMGDALSPTVASSSPSSI